MGECQQQKHTQHAPSTKMECDYLNGWIKKRSHTQKSHPKVVIPRDIAKERKKKKKKLQGKNHIYWRLTGGSNPQCCITQDSELNTLLTELFRPHTWSLSLFQPHTWSLSQRCCPLYLPVCQWTGWLHTPPAWWSVAPSRHTQNHSNQSMDESNVPTLTSTHNPKNTYLKQLSI